MELYSLSNILFGVPVESYLGCQMYLGSTKVYIAHTRTCGLALAYHGAASQYGGLL
jgi:hypothetical protein